MQASTSCFASLTPGRGARRVAAGAHPRDDRLHAVAQLAVERAFLRESGARGDDLVARREEIERLAPLRLAVEIIGDDGGQQAGLARRAEQQLAGGLRLADALRRRIDANIDSRLRELGDGRREVRGRLDLGFRPRRALGARALLLLAQRDEARLEEIALLDRMRAFARRSAQRLPDRRDALARGVGVGLVAQAVGAAGGAPVVEAFRGVEGELLLLPFRGGEGGDLLFLALDDGLEIGDCAIERRDPRLGLADLPMRRLRLGEVGGISLRRERRLALQLLLRLARVVAQRRPGVRRRPRQRVDALEIGAQGRRRDDALALGVVILLDEFLRGKERRLPRSPWAAAARRAASRRGRRCCCSSK